MEPVIEQQLIETVQGTDKGIGYLIQGMQTLLKESALNLKLQTVIAHRGTIHMIGGFAHGRTSNGDPFVLLYPGQKNLKHKVCRVYEQSFHELPWFVETNAIPENAQDGNPDKDKAKKLGIYQQCDWFEIATIDGKETQMGAEQRFFTTIRLLDDSKIEKVIPNTSNEIVTPTIDSVQAEAKLNAIIGEGIEELTKPYKYKDGTELADNPKLHEIFRAYWEQLKDVASDGAELKEWYVNNKELVSVG